MRTLHSRSVRGVKRPNHRGGALAVVFGQPGSALFGEAGRAACHGPVAGAGVASGCLAARLRAEGRLPHVAANVPSCRSNLLLVRAGPAWQPAAGARGGQRAEALPIGQQPTAQPQAVCVAGHRSEQSASPTWRACMPQLRGGLSRRHARQRRAIERPGERRTARPVCAHGLQGGAALSSRPRRHSRMLLSRVVSPVSR
jgi:hypothetical protein